MEFVWESLCTQYDLLTKSDKKICPIVHTYITAHIGILLDKQGNLLVALSPEVEGELIPVPCTIESDCRTRNLAPHLLSDQLEYLTILNGTFRNREAHRLYMQQLKGYVAQNPDDEYASAIYAYVSSKNLYTDIKQIIPQVNNTPMRKLNVIFCVEGIDQEGVDPLWTEYYTTKVLKPNGICALTGKEDYIPDAYPGNILSSSDFGKLFLGGDSRTPVGYITSQKIIHVLQYKLYGEFNEKLTEARYKTFDFLSGKISEDDMREWVEQNYTGKWDGFISRLLPE